MMSAINLSSKSKVGLIGVGNLGRAIANNLARKSWNLVAAFDASQENLQKLPTRIERASHARELVEGCDVTITALGVPADVESVFYGDNGILKAIKPGHIWVDHTTTDYHKTVQYWKMCNEKGAHVVESPATGGMALLKQGKMTTLVGCDEKVFDRVRPLLDVSFQNVLYMGGVGSATITKVISNMLAATHNVAMGEALMIAKRGKVDLNAFFDAIRVSAGNSFVFETEAPLVFNGTYNPEFTVKLHCKDLNLGNQLCKEFRVPIPLHGLVEEIYNHARFAYGDNVGSTIPPKLLEDTLREKLQIPGYDDWTYTTQQVEGGSLGVVHTTKSKLNKD